LPCSSSLFLLHSFTLLFFFLRLSLTLAVLCSFFFYLLWMIWSVLLAVSCLLFFFFDVVHICVKTRFFFFFSSRILMSCELWENNNKQNMCALRGPRTGACSRALHVTVKRWRWGALRMCGSSYLPFSVYFHQDQPSFMQKRCFWPTVCSSPTT
jgi:hypothetical protein